VRPYDAPFAKRAPRAPQAPGRAGTSTVLLLCAACMNMNSSATGHGTGQDGSTLATSATGVACTTDVTTQVTLCSGTSLCPNFLVNSSQFPNCGFRTLQPDFDLECLCYGNYLCPVGVASTCQQVSSLFTNKTLSDVCNQVSLGYCKQGPVTPSGTGGASSNCDQACYSGCVGAPSCIVACGC